YPRLILRRHVEVTVQQQIRLRPKAACPKVHQQEGEVIEHIGSCKAWVEFEAIEQDGFIVDYRNIREVQVAMPVPDAALPGAVLQQFGIASSGFHLSLNQIACARGR